MTSDPMQHNYMKKIAKLALKPGTYSDVTISHDPWCAIYNKPRPGYCNCDPDVTVIPLGN